MTNILDDFINGKVGLQYGYPLPVASAVPPLCPVCHGELIYDGMPAWYCETCVQEYDDEFELIPHRHSDFEEAE